MSFLDGPGFLGRQFRRVSWMESNLNGGRAGG